MIINELTDALSIALDRQFNGCRVYTPEVEQDLREPCFMITLVGAEKQPLLGARANMIYNFDVIYIPKSKAHTEMFGVADKMLAALNTVTTPDGTRLQAYDMRYELVDGELHFFVKYQLTVTEHRDTEKIESYSLNDRIGGM